MLLNDKIKNWKEAIKKQGIKSFVKTHYKAGIALVVIASLFTGIFMSNTYATDVTTDMKVFDIAAGNQFSVLLRSDGKVEQWGKNTNGLYGYGTEKYGLGQSDLGIPKTYVSGGDMGTPYLQGIIQIATGDDHILALSQSGEVYAWGLNASAQLGINTATGSASAPKKVLSSDGTNPLTNIVFIAAGRNSSYAVRSDGAVFAWGLNTGGQLGINTKASPQMLPAQVLAGEQGGGTYLTNVKMVEAGSNHAVAVTNDGQVFGWGQNDNGKLGRPSTTAEFLTPALMQPGDIGAGAGITTASLVAAGDSHTVIIANNGTTYTVGRNQAGQLGLGYSPNLEDFNTEVPKVVGIGGGNLLDSAVEVKAYGNDTLVRRANGVIYGFGDSTYNQIGDGSSATTPRSTPMTIKSPAGGDMTTAVKIAMGPTHGVAISNDYKVYSWGEDNTTSHQLGDGAAVNQSTPVVHQNAVQEFSDVKKIVTGSYHVLALKNDGTVWSFGLNTNGQLGDGSTTNRSEPVQVLKGEQGSATAFLTNIVDIWSGYSQSYAIDNTGKVYAWGFSGTTNQYLPINASGNITTPTLMHDTSNTHNPLTATVTKISVGNFGSYALLSDGSILSWGYQAVANAYGALGIPAYTSNYYYPRPVTSIGAPAVDIAATNGGCVALRNDGAIYSWGYNTYYELGTAIALSGYTMTPTQYVTGYTNAKLFGNGSYDIGVVNSAGRILMMGYNPANQINSSATAQLGLSARPDTTAYSTMDIANGNTSPHIYGVRASDGQVLAWGPQDSTYYQLGVQNVYDKSTTPLLVNNPDDPDNLLRNIKQIQAFFNGGVALTNDGQLYSWGYNGNSTLGDHSTNNRTNGLKVKVKAPLHPTLVNEYLDSNLFILPIANQTYPGSVQLKLRWLEYMDNVTSYDIYYTTQTGDPGAVTWNAIATGDPVTGSDILDDGMFNIWTQADGYVKYKAKSYMWTPPNQNLSTVRIKVVPHYN